MARLVSLAIREKTKRLPHLCAGTREFSAKAQAVMLHEGDKLMRFDVDDFYMQGKHELLVANCFKNYEGSARKWLKEAFDF